MGADRVAHISVPNTHFKMTLLNITFLSTKLLEKLYPLRFASDGAAASSTEVERSEAIPKLSRRFWRGRVLLQIKSPLG